MASARPLRDVFADLTGGGSVTDDPATLLRDQGHPALPDHLVAEAVISYADTAPAEVAEHLAPYVTAHSAVGADEVPGDEPPADWLDLLGTAPADSGPADIDDLTPAFDGLDDADLGPDPGLGLEFGTGAEPAPTFDTDDEPGDAGPEDHGELADLPPDPADLDDAAGWAAEDADPSTVDDLDPEPDDEPLD
jgi:hypothetical protein